MAADSPFPDLLARLRAGNPDAVREFVAGYEPFIRRSVRHRMAGTPAQGVADSDDLCQSVLGSLLIRLAAGEYELNSTADLERLLVTMIRNKVIALARKESAGKSHAKLRLLESGEDPSGASADDPARQVMGRDLLAEVRRRLDPEDIALWEHRQQGRSWDEIAAAVGGSAVVLRKRLSRALKAVAVELGLEADDEQ